MFDKSVPLFARILACIAQIETSLKAPKCYGRIAGNFDGMGISYGTLQFNLGTGTLQPLLKEFIVKNSTSFNTIFGTHAQELKNVLDKPTAEQLKWSSTIQNSKFTINPDWKLQFEALGLTPEMQSIQVSAAKNKYFKPAVSWMKEYGLKSERGCALLCDISVQNGSISSKVKSIILSQIKPSDDEVTRMTIIANRRAEAANPRWIEDVRSRKLTFATGTGIIHGGNYNLEKDFCITLSPINEAELV